MPSPFPGMDPYLESPSLWSHFHHHLIAALHQMVLSGVADRYKARVNKRSYTSEQALFTSVVLDTHQEEYIELRLREGRWVTLVDVVSPANKTTATGRQAYLAKREEARGAGANVVEIDLVLAGTPAMDFCRSGLPEHDYAITVTRANQPDRHHVYTAKLPERLPHVRVPLGGDDRDIDLQSAVTRSYEQGNFASQIDYRRDTPAALGESRLHWVEELLRQQQLR